jgi:hypothetical protein
MSEINNDGGPAFPYTGFTGMTKRHYFAGQAMQGLLLQMHPAGKVFERGDGGKLIMHKNFVDYVAGYSVELADALIKELGL